MKVEKTTVTKIVISGAKSLDPVHVFLEDVGPAQGRITINCYTDSWTAYWGGMGERTIEQFFCSCDEHYLANSLSRVEPSVFDSDGLKPLILKLRRTQEIDADAARDLFDKVDGVEDPFAEPGLMQAILGDEWWNKLPEKTNPDYLYLCRIIKAVQFALKEGLPG